jgi:flagellar basal body rod protein FlgB
MIGRLMGPTTSVAQLKEGLDVSVERTRGIANRIANAANGGFAGALDAAQAGADPTVDLESEMVALADEQIRFEALTRLLQKTDAQVRASVKERS